MLKRRFDVVSLIYNTSISFLEIQPGLLWVELHQTEAGTTSIFSLFVWPLEFHTHKSAFHPVFRGLESSWFNMENIHLKYRGIGSQPQLLMTFLRNAYPCSKKTPLRHYKLSYYLPNVIGIDEWISHPLSISKIELQVVLLCPVQQTLSYEPNIISLVRIFARVSLFTYVSYSWTGLHCLQCMPAQE